MSISRFGSVRPLSWVLVATLLAGCSGGSKNDPNRPPTYAVTGKVLYKGEPVADAGVSFRSSGSTPVSSQGRTDAQGKFTLTTFEAGDGAVAGQHMVTVTKSVVEGEDPSYFDQNSPNYGKTPPPTKTKYLVPMKFSKFETSGLSAEVKESGNDEITLDLKD